MTSYYFGLRKEKQYDITTVIVIITISCKYIRRIMLYIIGDNKSELYNI